VFADLDVTVRRNHQFITSYLPGGKDATVVWGSQDFKFKNSRKYPIRITTTVSGGVATIQIWTARETVHHYSFRFWALTGFGINCGCLFCV
jgi:vancomycin resistance protein YoaR